MGAIVVHVNWQAPASVATAEKMLRAAPHRGSVSSIVSTGQAVLGVVNRSDEIDATVAVEGQQAVALAGSLDNGADLLGEIGVQDQRISAAEAALRLFVHWGPAVVERFRGAFAGCFVDNSTLWCFRDHVGFRPLFYRQESQAAFCATEAKQVVAGSGVSREPNLDALQLVYYAGISEDASLSGVRRLMAGQIIEIMKGRLDTRRYWTPASILESAKLTLPEAREQLVEHLRTAVKRALTGTDAIAMSGGLDSTTIAAFAADSETGRQPFGYTFVYPDHPAVDESAYTRVTAESLGIELHERIIGSGPLDDLEKWVDLADGPWDTLPIPWAVEGLRFARAQGATNVLYGDVAEYVFTINSGLLGHLFYRGRWGALGRQLSSRYQRSGSIRGTSLLMLRQALPRPVANAYYRLTNRIRHHFPPWVDSRIVGVDSRFQLTQPQRKLWTSAQLAATRGTTTTMEANEIAAAASGVTIRRPLADVDLWEFFLSLPAEIKFPDATPKALLRQSMRGRLPDLIIDRPRKTVFDDHALSNAQVDRLRQLINPKTYRMPGVDYQLLDELLDSGALTVNDVIWSQDLAKAHAFVDLLS